MSSTVVENHLKYWTDKQPSAAGVRVAELLDAWDGLHHFEEAAMRKVDWAHPFFVKLTLRTDLATVDFPMLTRLVFLAHDHCIRVSVRPCNGSHLTLLFHPRKREGAYSERHPTLEHAVADWRRTNQERSVPGDVEACRA